MTYLLIGGNSGIGLATAGLLKSQGSPEIQPRMNANGREFIDGDCALGYPL